LKTWKEECAVVGIWNHSEASRLAYLGLFAMQHRGQESAGIVSLNKEEHIHHKGLGLVEDVFSEDDIIRLKGNTAIGHVRYSTTGQNLLTNAQPLTAQLLNGPIAVAHNGNIVNADKIRNQLIEDGSIFQGTNDTEILLHMLARNPSGDLVQALKDSVAQLEGAFSFVVLSHDRMVAIRDPYGFRPLVLGKKLNDNKQWSYVVASETCAFDLLGAQDLREIEPGEIFWMDSEGDHSIQFCAPRTREARCIFEHVYFARPDSVVFGQSVYESRKNFGKSLALENPVPADIVVPVPDSGVPAAIGYSFQSGVPFELGIIRNHYVGRTFIQPHQSIRSFGVKIKLNPQSAILSGKRVVVIDDSLVRGTTSKKIIGLVRAAGAKEVHMRVAAPPTIGPCFYGVDTPHKSQLIASQQSIEEIRKYIDADSLAYLSMDGLMSSLKASKTKYCAACFDGDYPTPLFGLDKEK
jgi:amidophosphoribosyltransferase